MRRGGLGKSRSITLRALHLAGNRHPAVRSPGLISRPPLAASYSSIRQISPEEDSSLGRIFDDQDFWREFRSAHSASGSRNRGLLQNAHLTGPDGYRRFATESIEKCQKLVARVVEEKDGAQRARIVKDLDRLSDLLCRVLDSTDFIRSTHPDPAIQDAASDAHFHMYEYMNVLNTYPELNERLKSARNDPALSARWSPEEQRVADILLSDFSNSAIDLPAKERQKFVDLSNDIARYSEQFLKGMRPARDSLTFASKRLKGMDPVRIGQSTTRGKTTIQLTGGQPFTVCSTVEDPEVRALVYEASQTAHPSQIETLDRLLRARAEVARLSKYESYGRMILPTKMARSPEAVSAFLSTALAENGSLLHQDLDRLRQSKAEHTGVNLDYLMIQAWDREFYSRRLVQAYQAKRRGDARLSEFFSLGSVMQGISRLFSRLYGITLLPRETSAGEVWNDEVRCLDVMDENGQRIAVLYCDLFERQGKSPNPAHFTLRCARRISEEEEAEATDWPLNDGMPVSARDPKTGTLHQLPTIALICDFARPRSGNKPTLLDFQDVETLFHEMGHAVHSFLGRTEYQNVAGTRCATDFAELPSVIMESFATAPEVLQLFAKHHETGEALPYQLVEDRQRAVNMLKGVEIETHVLRALLDQACHSAMAGSSDFSSTTVYHDVWRSSSSVQAPRGTSWQAFFGHLTHYGAVYYSYLFDRTISGKIWTEVFQDPALREGALSREAGEAFKNQVLRWGGSRDPWECVAGVLNLPELAGGGEEAMEAVGKWGVTARVAG